MKKTAIKIATLSLFCMGIAHASSSHVFECYPDPTPDPWIGYTGNWISVYQGNDEIRYDLIYGDYDYEETDCTSIDPSTPGAPRDCDRHLVEIQKGHFYASRFSDESSWVFSGHSGKLKISKQLIVKHVGAKTYQSYPATLNLNSSTQKLNCVKVSQK